MVVFVWPTNPLSMHSEVIEYIGQYPYPDLIQFLSRQISLGILTFQCVSRLGTWALTSAYSSSFLQKVFPFVVTHRYYKYC